jgi:hypothetical protein
MKKIVAPSVTLRLVKMAQVTETRQDFKFVWWSEQDSHYARAIPIFCLSISPVLSLWPKPHCPLPSIRECCPSVTLAPFAQLPSSYHDKNSKQKNNLGVSA